VRSLNSLVSVNEHRSRAYLRYASSDDQLFLALTGVPAGARRGEKLRDYNRETFSQMLASEGIAKPRMTEMNRPQVFA
jgi:hypothetical protein